MCMKARLVRLAKGILIIWGAFSFVLTIGIVALFAYQTSFGNRAKENALSPKDVRFVLGRCGLEQEQVESVTHSYVSSRSFSGDHLDAYAIKISNIADAELQPRADAGSLKWYRGDALPELLNEAIKSVSASRQKIPWFPAEAELRTSDFYVYPWMIRCNGLDPSAATLIFVRRSDRMLFYLDFKM